MAGIGPVGVHGGLDLGGGDLAVMAGQGQALVAGGLHGAGLVHVDVAAVGTQHPLPGLEGRVNHRKVGLGGAHQKLHFRFRRAAQGADAVPGLVAVGILSVAGGLFQIGAAQSVQYRSRCALAVVTFKTNHNRVYASLFIHTEGTARSDRPPAPPLRLSWCQSQRCSRQCSRQ